ncbi:potassium efflux protein KefA [Actinobacillus lignieresii]|nr:potassium efflux protein KefA [Actinobacillus lignieresii]
MIKRLFNPFLLGLMFVLSGNHLWAAELPTEKDLKAQIDALKKANKMKVIRRLFSILRTRKLY